MLKLTSQRMVPNTVDSVKIWTNYDNFSNCKPFISLNDVIWRYYVVFKCPKLVMLHFFRILVVYCGVSCDYWSLFECFWTKLQKSDIIATNFDYLNLKLHTTSKNNQLLETIAQSVYNHKYVMRVGQNLIFVQKLLFCKKKYVFLVSKNAFFGILRPKCIFEKNFSIHKSC